MNFEIEGQRKKGRSKRTWKKQVEEESMKGGLRREDALCQTELSVGINQIHLSTILLSIFTLFTSVGILF